MWGDVAGGAWHPHGSGVDTDRPLDITGCSDVGIDKCWMSRNCAQEPAVVGGRQSGTAVLVVAWLGAESSVGAMWAGRRRDSQACASVLKAAYLEQSPC